MQRWTGHIAGCAAALMLVTGGMMTAAATASAKVFDPQLFTLDNGMQVALIENHRVPAVTHMVWYRVGAVDEPRGKSGIAHFLEHLMFKGTKNIPPGEFSKIIARHGGDDNAFTSWDYTAYYQKIAAQHLPKVMAMEAERMRGLILDDDTVGTERNVIIEERRQRIDSNPLAQMEEQLMAVLYQHQPYRVPIIGWMHEMESLNRDDALDFYKRYYAPSNAILVVSGAVDKQTLQELAEETYGKLPTLPQPERQLTAEPPTLMPRALEFVSDKAELPIFKAAWLMPSYSHHDDPATPYALKVLEQYMAGSGASRLYQELVINRKIATDVGVYYEPERRGLGMAEISIVPVDGSPETFAKNEQALLEVLADIAANGVEEKALQRAVASLVANAVYARDSLMTPAMAIGEALVLGYDVEQVENWPERIRAVTTADVQKAAALFEPYKRVTARLIPLKKAAANDDSAAAPQPETPAAP